MRRLLPYEQQLIEALGISEEEYWQFYLARLNYRDNKEGTALDIRNEAGTIALVLTIVGTLAQVGAALLAPKPELPDTGAKQGRRTRNITFAPRYGFNSLQEVARYGEPVNLVYTNIDDHAAAGVRVNTSLVWSAVQSFGTSQFVQMLAVVGAGDVQSYAYGRTAFGQAPLRDFATQRYWLYANEASGNLRFADKKRGDDSLDPSSDGQAAGDWLYKASLGGLTRAEGFSQAFSPSSNSSLGLYNPVPIFVQVVDRNDNGKVVYDDLGTRIAPSYRGAYWPNSWNASESRPAFPVGGQLVLNFIEDDQRLDDDREKIALDYRSSLIASFDAASLYKIGGAKFKLIGADETSFNRAEGSFTFQCIEAGVLCEEDYETKNYFQNEEELERQLENFKAQRDALNRERESYGPLYIGASLTQLPAIEAQIEAYDEAIENLTAIIRGNIDDETLYNLASNEGKFGGLRNRIDNVENTIKQLRDAKDDLQDGITDEEGKPVAQQNRTRIQNLKQRKRQVNQQIRDTKNELRELYGKLGARAAIAGIYDNNKGSNAREERRRFKREIRRLNKRYAEIAATLQRDFGAEAARESNWQQRFNSVQSTIDNIQRQLRNPDSFNDHFNVKCIAKVDEVSYETVTSCNIVNFSLKSRVFKRVQGRQSKYADNKEQGHKDSDNGLRIRVSMFWLLYQKEGDTIYRRAPMVFAIRKGVETDNYTDIRFIGNQRSKWRFKMEPIIDFAAELRTHTGGANINVAYLETRSSKNSQRQQTVNLPDGNALHFTGRLIQSENRLPPLNRNPRFIDEWGVFSMRSDTQISFSFDNGPEISLLAVTEQQVQPYTSGLYGSLSLLGFNAYSGKGIQDLRSLSAYVTRGKKVRRLGDDGSYTPSPIASTSYAPEIFLDSILDSENGIGAYASINGVDLQSLGNCMKFCRANRLFMDGVVADPQSWREFWAVVAPYSLLEFAKIGGKESLAPALPYDATGAITRNITISALFNQGNILEGSYREEFVDYGDNSEDLLATIVYRNTEEDNVFPGNTSVQIRLADADEATCIRQTFDLSNYVASREQAIKYGKLLCQQRRHSRRGVEFKTFPTESPVHPGAYIYVQTDQNAWDDLRSGSVLAGGELNLPVTEAITSGTFNALLYKGDEGVRSVASVSVTNNTASALAAYEGWLFVLGTEITSKRVFRVVEVSMEEEGEITINAIEHPCDESGGQTLSRIARFDDGLFAID